MDSKAEVETRLVSYIQGLATPQPDLGGKWSICPFAKGALTKRTFDIFHAEEDLFGEARRVADDFAKYPNLEVALVCSQNLKQFSPEALDAFIKGCREHYRERDIYMLYDHPAEPETLNGVRFDNGHYAIIFIQSRSALENAAKQIAKKGYYKAWPQADLERLIRNGTSFYHNEVLAKPQP